MRYYLAIDGIRGGSPSVSNTSWLEVESFTFEAAADVTVGGGTISASKTKFDPVQVVLSNETSLPSLMANMVDGVLGTIHLQAVDDLGKLVYDMQLEGVAAGVSDSSGSGVELKLDYDQIAIQTISQDRTGQLRDISDFGWDIAKNAAGPKVSTAKDPVAVAETSPSHFYMIVDGLKGDAKEQGHASWFEIDSFDVAGTSTGDRTRVTSFGPLSVDVSSDAALTEMLDRVAKGTIFDGVHIQGVSFDGIKIVDTYDLKIGNVAVLSVTDDLHGGYNVEFDYSVIDVTTRGLNGTETDSYRFDLAAGKVGGTINPIDAGAGTGGAVQAEQYYLRLEGIGGDIQSGAYQGCFAIDDPTFSVSHTPGSVPDFSNVSVTLASDAALHKLFQTISLAGKVASASIFGVASVNSKQQTVFELGLDGVLITELTTTESGGPVLGLDYARIGVSTFAFDPVKNALTSNPSFGFNILTGKAESVDITGGAQAPAPAVAPEKYYVMIEGVTGNSDDPSHAGWFDLDSFNLEVTNSTLVVANGGAGEASFEPLGLTFGDDTGVVALTQKIMAGVQIASVRIEGVAGNKSDVVYQLDLNGLVVTNIDDSDAPGHSISLNFQKVVIYSTGTSGSLEASGYDLTTGKAINKLAIGDPGAGPQELQATKYFLAIDGVDGSSRDDRAHKGWLDVADFSIQLDAPADLGVAGKTDYGPLDVTVVSDTGLSKLLEYMSSGKSHNVKLDGITDDSKLAYSVELGDAFVTGITDTDGPGYSVTLDYTKIEVTTSTFDSATGESGTIKAGWDRAMQKVTKFDVSPIVAKTADTSPTAYYMVVDGVHGDRDDTSHGSWFTVDSFSFGAETQVSIGSGGAGAGKAAFDPLTVHIASEDGLTDLLGLMARGKFLDGIHIEGTALNANDGEKTVYTLDLGNILVSDISDSSGGGYDVTFVYGKIMQENLRLNGDSISKFGFDILSGKPTSWTNGLTIVGSAGADFVIGTGAGDELMGLRGNDRISGQDGNDVVNGGAGRDLMNGGGGNDRFDFDAIADTSAVASRYDKIAGFEVGLDTIDLIDVYGGTMKWMGTGAFTGEGQVRAYQDGGFAIIEINVDANLASDGGIRLTGVSADTLQENDFIL